MAKGRSRVSRTHKDKRQAEGIEPRNLNATAARTSEERLDPLFEMYRAQWEQSHRLITLKQAVNLCQDHRVGEPDWLHDALYQCGKAQALRAKKAGPRSDLLRDDPIYATVEQYIAEGLSQPEAFYRTAIDFRLKTTRGANKGEVADFTVKHIWERQKDRIVKVDPAENYGLEWRFKPESLRNDKNLAMSENVPSWLRTKNK